MENNKGYLRRFPVMFLISLVAGIFIELVVNKVSLEERMTWWFLAIQYLPLVVFFINLGLATDKWKAVGGAAAVVCAITIGTRYEGEALAKAVGQSWFFICIELAYIFSLFSFFLFAGIPAKKLPVVFAGVCLVLGMNTPYGAGEGFEWLGRLFSIHLNIPGYVIGVIPIIVVQLVQTLLFCELLNYGHEKNQGAQQRIINPGNEYEKPSATLLFLVLKVFLMFAVVGLVQIAKSWENMGYYGGGTYLWYRKIQFLVTIVLLFGLAWYLRKFLLEYFFSYGHASKTLYWALLLPVLGIFIWLIALMDSHKLEKKSDRNNTLSRYANDTATVIIAIVVFCMVIQALLVVGRGQGRLLIPLLISGGLFALMVSSRGGYLLNLILNLGLLVFFVLVKQGRDAGLPLLLPLLALNVIQVYLLNAAFHFEDFSYLHYEEEEEQWEPGKDLF